VSPAAVRRKIAWFDFNPQANISRHEPVTDIPNIPLTSHHRIEADGVHVFYREAGPADAPVILLLHGFPTSSFQYREPIPRLADRYRVIAPDLPGFGFTHVPAERGYKYTFDALAETIFAFTQVLRELACFAAPATNCFLSRCSASQPALD